MQHVPKDELIITDQRSDPTFLWQRAPATQTPVEYISIDVADFEVHPSSPLITRRPRLLGPTVWTSSFAWGRMLQRRLATVKTAYWKNCVIQSPDTSQSHLFSSLCNARHPGLVGVASEQLPQMVFYRHELGLCI